MIHVDLKYMPISVGITVSDSFKSDKIQLIIVESSGYDVIGTSVSYFAPTLFNSSGATARIDIDLMFPFQHNVMVIYKPVSCNLFMFKENR